MVASQVSTGSSAAGAPQRAICVLGAGRSGTSLTTGILQLLGVYLGSEHELFDADRDNATGYWENRRIARLNHRILKVLGGSNLKPPRLLPGWEESAKLARERDDARVVIDEAFGGRPLWGWKDPKTSLTLPFWHQLVPEVRHVICLRNPLSAVASAEAFAAQRQISVRRERLLALWQLYIASAVANTAGSARIFVFYEDYFEDSQSVVRRLAGFVGREPQVDTEVERKVEDLRRGDLWHNRPPAAAALEELAPPTVGCLYRLLQQASTTSAKSTFKPPGASGAASAPDRALNRYAAELLQGMHGE